MQWSTYKHPFWRWQVDGGESGLLETWGISQRINVRFAPKLTSSVPFFNNKSIMRKMIFLFCLGLPKWINPCKISVEWPLTSWVIGQTVVKKQSFLTKISLFFLNERAFIRSPVIQLSMCCLEFKSELDISGKQRRKAGQPSALWCPHPPDAWRDIIIFTFNVWSTPGDTAVTCPLASMARCASSDTRSHSLGWTKGAFLSRLLLIYLGNL